MAYQDTKLGFIDYRYYKSKYHFTKKIALKFEINQTSDTILFSCAICSEEDNFCRATARDITDKRFDNNETYSGKYDRKLTIVDNIKLIANKFATDPDLHSDRMIKQLDEAFAEVEIGKMIDDTNLFTEQVC